MTDKNPVTVEMFYTFTCPNCRILKRLLDEVLPCYGDKFVLKQSMASSPLGYFRTLRMGIFTVPTLLINNEIVFKNVPSKEELIKKLNSYSN